MTGAAAAAAAALAPGFADPVLDAQRCFRAVLEAMSRPGRVLAAGAGLVPPAPLSPAAAAVLLTLVDAETPLWLDAGAAAAAVDWTRFHCGCAILDSAADAAFAVSIGASPPPLASLAQGTDEDPQASATLILQVAGLAEGEAGWRLSGPGIETAHRLRVDGAPGGFTAEWRANRARFPRGVDVILCAGSRLAALPRTVAIAEG